MDVRNSDSKEHWKNEAEKYVRSGSFRRIQTELTERALELIEFPKGAKILDVGCGTGISSDVLVRHGLRVIGIDNSPEMLSYYKHEKILCSFDLIPLSKDSVDGFISISALQWSNDYNSVARELFRVSKNSGVIQFYPRDENDMKSAISAFKKVGFKGQIIIDRGGSSQKADKKFLVLNK